MSSFKPGDWVVGSKVCRKPKRFTTVSKLKEIQGADFAYPYILEDGSYCEIIKLWKPKVGEWVWSKGSYTQAFIFKWTSSHEQAGIINYTNYEPFIGQLPTFIKDPS